jgi:parallel beta-helix repeat protein
MKSAHNHILSSITASVLLIGLGVQFISGVPLGRERSIALAAPRSQGNIRIVASTADSGPGTLRQALLDAQSGDIITFDPLVFPPSAPVTISLTSSLPHINQGNLTIDASNAGVILDGSQAGGEWTAGIEINSEHNVIRGLQVIHFTGPGILLGQPANFNTVGGDRNVGNGPLGQGNLFSDNADGVAIFGSSDNTILGNLIGTNVYGTGALGNRTAGIFIEQDGKRNVIGPNNIIAYNGDPGVDIRSENSFANKITQNSIHDNRRRGIQLFEGSSFNTATPFIFDFNLSAGTVAGTACVDCTVEIFSDSEDQGEKYEGRITADGSGSFAFSKGSSFSGPHLTATATDTDANTSQFSPPTSGASRSLIIQAGNSMPRLQLRIKQSSELQDNRIASMWDWYNTTGAEMEEIVKKEVLAIGLKRARLSVNGIEPNTIHWDRPELTINPEDDQVFTLLANNGVKITYVLTFWDKATYPGGVGTPCPRFKTEGEILRYLDFVRFIVHHFKGRVQIYEIWNEPNNTVCPQWIEVEDYINLVQRVVPVIRQEYPGAKIQVGGTSYLNESPAYDYLLSILRSSDIMPLVDVISWHPMYGTSPEFDPGYYSEYPTISQDLKDVAFAHGFKGEFEADELTWWTIEQPEWDGWSRRYKETIAAKYYARGILMNLGMDITAGTGGASYDKRIVYGTVGNIATVVAGTEPSNIPFQIQTAASNLKSYTFSLPGSGYLMALWKDGAAVDDDPGKPATLTLNGLTDQKVVGIDVLYGYQQQLVANEEDGNTVIRNLLVKDYPLILRITPVSYTYLPIITKGAVVR